MNLSPFYKSSIAKSATVFATLCLLGASLNNASAYIVVLDMDTTTAPVETFPGSGTLAGAPGPAVGIESTITATAGTPFLVVAYLVFEVGDAGVLFDYVGADLNWGVPGDTATLSVTGPAPAASFGPLAGSLAGLPTEGFSLDFFDLRPQTPGSTDGLGRGLAEDAVPTLAGYSANMGGVGYFDPPIDFNLFQFGGYGDGGHLVNEFIDLFSVELTLTGAPGSTITVDPSGIFDPTGGGPGLPPAVLEGGDAVYTSVFGGATSGTFFTGNTASVVPEPSRALLGLLGLAVVLLRRRRP